MKKEEILEFARTLGLEKVGFSENAVVALFPYYVKGEEGNISVYARGRDYHLVAEEKLQKLAEFLVGLGATETFVHVDKGELDDRKAAFQAGLGFFGKNGMLICKEFGSYFFIGQVVHNLKIEADLPLTDECFSCGACLRECPGGALNESGFVLEKCLSQISQRKGELSSDEKELIYRNGLCWGCDVCQRVCPHNRDLETTAMPEFLIERKRNLSVEDVEKLSNKEFKEKFGEYAFSWRGKNVILRNLRVIEERKQF